MTLVAMVSALDAMVEQVGERLLAVEVEDEPRHLAGADVEQARPLAPQLAELVELQSTRLSSAEHMDQHEHALVVELAVLLPHSFHVLRKSRQASIIAETPLQLPRATARRR